MPTESIQGSDSETDAGVLRNDTTQSDSTKWKERLNFLNDLRDTLVREGITSLSQLDAKLGEAVRNYNLTL